MKLKFSRKYLASVEVPELKHSIDLVALYQRHTYLELLEGVPNERINQRILDHLTDFPDKHFGYSETFLIPPQVDLSIPERPVLPLLFCACSLESDYEPDEESAASSLCVLWLHNNPDLTPSQILNEVVKHIDWVRQAKGFIH